MDNKKIHKSLEEQIELLKSRGLKIINYKKFKWYLNSYNYQNFINGYNDLFMVGENRNTNKYKTESNSEGIIELFNFDRQISQIILSSIQNIERKLSTALAYKISEIMSKYDNKTGQVFSLHFDNIIIKKIFGLDKESWSKTKKHIFKNIYLKDPLFHKWKSNSKIPIWHLVIKLSFGEIIFILEKINSNIFYEIIKFSTIRKLKSLNNKSEIISILKILKEIRNRVCHNNVLYNLRIIDSIKIRAINNLLNTNSNVAYLKDVIEVIKLFDTNESNKNFLSKIIIKKINSCKNIDKSIKDKISNLIINKKP